VSEPQPFQTRARAALAERIQGWLRRAGYELHPYDPEPVPAREDLVRARLLTSEGVGLLLDVGANAGQYAVRMRRAGFTGRVVSFEPLSDAFAALERRAAGDPRWEARRLALSDTDGTAEIHVAGNSTSSSLLDMGEQHLASAPESAYVGSEQVRTARLDSIWDELAADGERVFLKLDVQGFELHVLRGGEQALGALRGVQAELALAHLYEGDSPWREVVDHLEARGFELAGVEPGFEDPESGRMLQFDGLFVRS
jgi:FkbM family methyltransferase